MLFVRQICTYKFLRGSNQARTGDLMADVFVSGMWWLAGVKIHSIVLYKVTEVHNVSVCGIEYCVVLGSFICKILCAWLFVLNQHVVSDEATQWHFSFFCMRHQCSCERTSYLFAMKIKMGAPLRLGLSEMVFELFFLLLFICSFSPSGCRLKCNKSTYY